MTELTPRTAFLDTDACSDEVPELSELQLAEWASPLVGQFRRFSMIHQFAIEEVTTKINILREEFINLHDYNPIEHVNSRLKTVESVIAKARRIDCALELDAVRDRIRDVAGVRVTCSFVSDVYRMFDVFTAQSDVTVVDVDDYIARPKPNGYQSLHATVQLPVFLSTGAEDVYVEMQFRTVAMDFWASLEHKIYYKYDRAVPDSLLAELKEAADTAAALDQRMQRLHREVASLPPSPMSSAIRRLSPPTVPCRAGAGAATSTARRAAAGPARRG